MTIIPLLFVAQLALFAIAIRRSCRQEGARGNYWLFFVPVALVVWGLSSASFAITGLYDAPRFLRLLPGLWLPLIPLVIVFGTLVHPLVRMRLRSVALSIPDHWLVGVQALRIAAIGTLIKTAQGVFPIHVELAIGVTDLAFGLSALALFAAARAHRLSPDALAIWHITGFAIIAVPGFGAIQFGLPGPAQLPALSLEPTSAAMLDFPMALAPTLVVPIFLALNIWGAWAALARSRVVGDLH